MVIEESHRPEWRTAMFSMRRINRALGVSVGVVGLVASAYVNVSATKAEAVSSQPVVSAELNEDSVRLPATAPCTRMTDWFLNCLCPSTYSAFIQGSVVDTPASMWWGLSKAWMWDDRPASDPLGKNPRIYWSTGSQTYATGQNGPVYFSPGSGYQADQWSWMDGICISVFLPQSQVDAILQDNIVQHQLQIENAAVRETA